MGTLPLIRHTDLDSPIANVKGRTISVRQFLSDLTHVANFLPKRRYLLNLCVDRYHFTVVFCAALLRNQVSLLPPNQTPELIEQLRTDYSDIYCLKDLNEQHGLLETFHYPKENIEANNDIIVPAIDSEQTAALVFTSGSTGKPVAHKKTWGNLVKSALGELECLRLDEKPGMTIVGTVPPQHMYGLESTVLMILQGSLIMHSGRPFYPADITSVLSDCARPRGLVTTPVHLRTLVNDIGELPNIDFLLCATSPLSPQLASEAEKKFSTPLYEIYGCTEAGQVATRRPTKTEEWQLFPNLHIYQDGNNTWVKGGHVNGDILLNDIIELREGNKFTLHGRTGDLVNIAGKRTSLAHLNYHLNCITGVIDGVYVMRDDNRHDGISRLMAFVVAPALSEEDILRALRQRIDSAFMPRPLYLVESLPRNATGKLTLDAINKLERSIKGTS